MEGLFGYLEPIFDHFLFAFVFLYFCNFLAFFFNFFEVCGNFFSIYTFFKAFPIFIGVPPGDPLPSPFPKQAGFSRGEKVPAGSWQMEMGLSYFKQNTTWHQCDALCFIRCKR